MKLLMSTVRDAYALRVVDPLTTHGTDAEVVAARYAAFDEMLAEHVADEKNRAYKAGFQSASRIVPAAPTQRRLGW